MRGDRLSTTRPASLPTVLTGLCFTAAIASAVALRLGQADAWWIAGAVLVAAATFGLAALGDPRPTPNRISVTTRPTNSRTFTGRKEAHS